MKLSCWVLQLCCGAVATRAASYLLEMSSFDDLDASAVKFGYRLEDYALDSPARCQSRKTELDSKPYKFNPMPIASLATKIS